VLVRDAGGTRCTAVIVETEAYDGPADRASHARFGRTPRTAIMFGPGGRAYVYLVYGMHRLLNVVAGPEGSAAAVLLRAASPLDGTAEMAARRGRTEASPARLAAGPALLTQALDVGLDLNGTDLTMSGPLWLAPPPPDVAAALAAAGIVAGPRIGVAYAEPPWADLPWRFGWRGHPALSRPF
jgi:DNA-3-methyladenine glycosylase